MHRNKTRLAARAHRVGKALERRGIRATYEMHDRVLSNRSSRRLHSRHLPVLDATQQRIVEALDADGYAIVPFAELLPDDDARHAVEAQGDAFAASTADALAREAAGEEVESLRRRAGKEFVVRLRSYGVELSLDDPWLAFGLSRRMLDIANAYLRMWSKLEYVDMWYSVPQPADAERVASQRWHRDFNDRHLLKAFLYLVDVDADTGPFEYVPGSAGSGPYARDWPWRPLGENYPSPEALAMRVPESAIRTFTAPRGTVIFCDTSGFHRGGFTTTRPRVLATVTYSSPASLASLTERNFTLIGPAEALDEVQRYAVT
jgi:ectoine hydroxylase-related dioxygenase (phytanoyl-CoA dioxygenase family)